MYTTLSNVDEPLGASSKQVLKRDIPWDSYVTGGVIKVQDLRNIKLYDKKSPVTQSDVLSQEGAAVVGSFVSVLKNVTKEDVLQYVLALLTDILEGGKERVSLFFAGTGNPAVDLYPVFLRLLQRTDWFTQEKACELLTVLLDNRPDKHVSKLNGLTKLTANNVASASSSIVGTSDSLEQVFVAFIDWLCSQLRRPSNPTKSVPVAVAALSKLLKEKSVRELFTRTGGVQLLAPLLRVSGSPPPSPQLLYDACVCVWNVSFYTPAIQVMGTTGLVPALVEVVRVSSKEKVVRVAAFALKNLLQVKGLELDVQVMESGLAKAVAGKLQQNYDDDELVDTLEWLREWLERNIHDLSSWERYKKELMSGNLDWSPMHTSEKFWRDNVGNFEDRDFQALHVLLKLLEQSRESRTLAVGCHDLGQFIIYYPHGRQLVMDLRGKELVMRLMMHPDGQVQKQALLCVQRMLLAKDKLDFLNSSVST